MSLWLRAPHKMKTSSDSLESVCTCIYVCVIFKLETRRGGVEDSLVNGMGDTRGVGGRDGTHVGTAVGEQVDVVLVLHVLHLRKREGWVRKNCV